MKQKNGESLAEVLVAVLISVVGMLLLSSFVFSATHIMEKSEAKSQELYNALTISEVRSAGTSGQTVIVEYDGAAKQKAYSDVSIYKDSKSTIVSYEKE